MITDSAAQINSLDKQPKPKLTYYPLVIQLIFTTTTRQRYDFFWRFVLRNVYVDMSPANDQESKSALELELNTGYSHTHGSCISSYISISLHFTGHQKSKKYVPWLLLVSTWIRSHTHTYVHITIQCTEGQANIFQILGYKIVALKKK